MQVIAHASSVAQTRMRITILALVAPLLLGISTCFATTNALVYVQDAGGTNQLVGDNDQAPVGVSQAEKEITNFAGEGAGVARASSAVTEGRISVSAVSHAESQGFADRFTSFAAVAEGSWQDHVNFSSPTSIPFFFTVEADLYLSGGLGGSVLSGSSRPQDSFTAETVNLTGIGIKAGNGRLRVDGAGLLNEDTPIAQVFHFRESVSSLEGLNLLFTLRVVSQSVASTDFASNQSAVTDGYAAYNHTLRWGGITSITDSSGNALTGIIVTSTSGFDYMARAVPEPSVYASFVSGLLVLFLSFKKRHPFRM